MPLDLSQFKVWTEEEFERAFPPSPVSSKPNGGAQGGNVGAGGADTIDEAFVPDDLLDLIRNGAARQGSLPALYGCSCWIEGTGLFGRCDLQPPHVLSGRDRKQVSRPKNRLRREIERAYNKLPDASGVPPVPPVASPQPSSSSSSGTPLANAHDVFKRWLGATYDLSTFEATACAGAAEKLGGDPLWLIVISGSGNAKTETVQSLSGAGAHITSTITSEGALLSATTRSRGATGGLLHKIGARGLLVIKDLTSILAMDSNVRGSVLAAFREIHDGRWERNVGFAGGRTLTWTGRIVIVAACTTAWDEARKVIEAMGDRFVLVRSDFDDWPGGIDTPGDWEHGA